MNKRITFEELQKKCDGIIPLRKISVKNWMKYDKRDTRGKAIELYRYGKSQEDIINILNITSRDLKGWIDELYNQKKITEVQNDWSLPLRTPSNFSNWNSMILKKCWR